MTSSPFARLFSNPLARTVLRWRHVRAATDSAARRRLSLLSVTLVAGIAFADWQFIRSQRAATIEDFIVGQTNLANGMSAQTSLALAMVDTALRDIGGKLSATVPQSSDAVLDRLRDQLKRLSGVESLSIIDESGRVVLSTRARPQADAAGPEDFSSRYFFRQLSSAAGPAVSFSRPMAAGDGWTVIMAHRIDNAAGRFAGAVAAEISLADLEEFYRVAMPVGRTITVVRPDGMILMRYPPGSVVAGARVPAHAPFYAAAATGGGHYEARDYLDGRWVIAVVRPLRDLPLIIETFDPEDDVLAGWSARRGWFMLGGLVAGAGAILLVELFLAQLHRLAVRNRELDDARRQLDMAISNVSQGISFFDGHERMILCNQRFGEIYRLPSSATRAGIAYAEMIGQWFAFGVPPIVTISDIMKTRANNARSGKPYSSVVELVDGRTVAVRGQPMEDGGWVATHDDITERRRAEQRINFLARHDMLTELPNRSLLTERIDQARAGASRGIGFAVLFLDLDRFKAVNDTLGHAAGDQLLQEAARRLRSAVREGDTVARLGGDEFVVLQTKVQAPQTAATLAQRIISEVGAPYSISGNEVLIGVSIGIDIALTDDASADELLKNADLALYISKAEGRGTFRFFEPEMDARVQNRHALERDLRGALARGDFVLHYQAIVSARSGRVRGFEALPRWNHPERGQLGPEIFIAVAEESGLIAPIGEWVLRQACADAAAWPEAMRVSVNLAPAQFRAETLVASVRDALAAAGLAATRLELEITEPVLLDDNAKNVEMMHEFRSIGIGIVMDGFGVGSSSLSSLRRFPFRRIKIDRGFVTDLATSQEAVSVARAILGLCRDLGINTVADGVDHADQLRVLLAEGCAEMQGYLFSRPKSAALLGEVLAAGRLTVPQATTA